MTCYGKLNGESMIDLFKNGMALVKISVIISIAFMVNKLIFFGSVHYYFQSKTPTSVLVTDVRD